MPLLKPLILSLRPQQWIKNLFLLAPLFFSKNLLHGEAIVKAVLGLLVYNLLSGAIYIFNDIVDLESDKSHPQKSKRPLAAGKISITQAKGFAVSVLVFALGSAYYLDKAFFYVCLMAIILQLLYSLLLKKMVILDVMAIALAFVLRVLAGAVLIHVQASAWILICALLLALFLALGKRRHELLFAAHIELPRKVLSDYTLELLDQMLAINAAATIITYALYTISDSTQEHFHTKNLVYTLPFVLYGIFRYLYLIHKQEKGGNPETVLVTDKPLYLNILFWILTSGFIIYFA